MDRVKCGKVGAAVAPKWWGGQVRRRYFACEAYKFDM